MRTLQIAAIAVLAFSSAAYAAGEGPYHRTHAARHLHAVMHRPIDNGQPANNGWTANTVAPAPIAHPSGWGPGDAWGSFPGSLNANGG